MRMQRQRLRMGGMMRPLFSQQSSRRQLPVNFSIVRRRPACALRERLSTSLRTTTTDESWVRCHAFEGVLCGRVELFVLREFLDDLLNDHVIVDARVTGIQLDVVVARHGCDFDSLLGRRLHITVSEGNHFEFSLLHTQLWMKCVLKTHLLHSVSKHLAQQSHDACLLSGSRRTIE